MDSEMCLDYAEHPGNHNKWDEKMYWVARAQVYATIELRIVTEKQTEALQRIANAMSHVGRDDTETSAGTSLVDIAGYLEEIRDRT